MSAPLVEFRDVDVIYEKRGQPPAHILKSISMTIARGETLGLVGESGAGKSTIGKCVLGVAPVVSGDVLLNGKSLLGLDHKTAPCLNGRDPDRIPGSDRFRSTRCGQSASRWPIH